MKQYTCLTTTCLSHLPDGIALGWKAGNGAPVFIATVTSLACLIAFMSSLCFSRQLLLFTGDYKHKESPIRIA